MQKEYSNIIFISRTKERNFSESYNEGFKVALAENADFIIQMDADGSHSEKYLQTMITELDNYDFVIGSRYVNNGGVKNWPKAREFLSKSANWYARFLLNMPFYDVTSGFNAWKSEVLKAIDFSSLSNKGYVFQVWLKWNAYSKKFKGKEIPIIFIERKFGKSKLRYQMIFESLYEIFKIFLKKK